jgi:hypothetical protein
MDVPIWTVDFSEGPVLYTGAPAYKDRATNPGNFNADFNDLIMAENVALEPTGGPTGTPCLSDYNNVAGDLQVSYLGWDLARSDRSLTVDPGDTFYLQWDQQVKSGAYSETVYAPVSLGEGAAGELEVVFDADGYFTQNELSISWAHGEAFAEFPSDLSGTWVRVRVQGTLSTWPGAIGTGTPNSDGALSVSIDGTPLINETNIPFTIYTTRFSGGWQEYYGLIDRIYFGFGIFGDIDNIELGEVQPDEPLVIDPAPPRTLRAIRRLRQAPHLADEDRHLYHHAFELEFERGVGDPAREQAGDPQWALRWSDDGGMTWSREAARSAGEIGATTARAIWRRLGRSRSRVYQVVITDPVKVALLDAYLDITAGAS